MTAQTVTEKAITELRGKTGWGWGNLCISGSLCSGLAYLTIMLRVASKQMWADHNVQLSIDLN